MNQHRVYDIYFCPRCKLFEPNRHDDPFNDVMGVCKMDKLEIKQGEVDPLLVSYNCPDFVLQGRR